MSRPPSTRTPRPCSTTAALDHDPDPETPAQVEEALGDVAFRAGHVDDAIARESALTFQVGRERRSESASCIGRSARALAQGRSGGLDLSLPGGHRPAQGRRALRELIELYEEAASLYVETGDNMLAIYAAEKAQRLAEALGQSATVSRTHLTFGRVFGRIGDTKRARQSLERALGSPSCRSGTDDPRAPRARPAPRDRRGRLRGGEQALSGGAAARR